MIFALQLEDFFIAARGLFLQEEENHLAAMQESLCCNRNNPLEMKFNFFPDETTNKKKRKK